MYKQEKMNISNFVKHTNSVLTDKQIEKLGVFFVVFPLFSAYFGISMEMYLVFN